MADLSARRWNPMTERVAGRIVDTVFHLVDAAEQSGWPPFTEPPNPDTRWSVYIIRPPLEWRMMARTDPDRALEEIRDFANMARRRDEPQTAEEAATAVLSEFAARGLMEEANA